MPRSLEKSKGSPAELRILILEDNPNDLELIHYELQEAGFSFQAKCVYSKEAFEKTLKNFSPDLILSDYDLPTYDGASALAYAKSKCPEVPFILVTGAVTEERAIEILTSGAKDYVLKSRIRRLGPAVKRALAEAAEHQARLNVEAALREANRTLEKKVRLRTAALEKEIEERKQMEKALRESEIREHERVEDSAALLDAVPIPVIVVHDPDSRHMTGNQAAEELLRVPRGAEISLSAPAAVRPRHFKAVKDGRELRPDELPAQRAARGEYVWDFEFSLVFKDGTIKNVLGYGTPLYDQKGYPHGAVGALVDITEHKRMEEELRTSEAVLEDAGEFASIGTWEWDISSGKLTWSEQAYHILGAAPGKDAPTHDSFLERVHPEDRGNFERALESALSDTGPLDLEYRIITPEGTTKWVHSRGEVMLAERARTSRMIGIVVDITARKQP